MVRVLRSHCTDRIILKGFQGYVRDLSFAFHNKRGSIFFQTCFIFVPLEELDISV